MKHLTRIELIYGDPPQRPRIQTLTYPESRVMAVRTFVATLSPVVPTDNVTSREFHVFDKNQGETVFLINPGDNSFSGSIDDTLTPGTCQLIDVNSAGKSLPSPAVPLTPPGPTPPTPGVPTTPTITGVTWTN